MVNESIPHSERVWAMISHFSTFCGFMLPFGNLAAPLVIWLAQRDGMPFVEDQAKESLNFQISMMLFLLLSLPLMLICIGYFTFIATLALWIIAPIIAGVKANDGEIYRYPFCIRFV